MSYLTVLPAYGRDYQSAKTVRAGWAAGQDFRISDVSCRWNGSVLNRAGKPAGVTLSVRYRRLTRSVLVA
jgi:hypothetical protein